MMGVAQRAKALAFVIVALGVVASVGTARAGGPPILHETTVTMDTPPATQPDTNPCTGIPATDTSSGSFVFHITEFADGTVHVSVVSRSRFFIDTIDPAGVDYTGHEADTFSFNGTNAAATMSVTFTPVLVGTDGTHLVAHEVGHFTANANGVVTVSFDNFTGFRGCPA